MYPVHAPLFDAVGPYLFAEAGGIAGEGVGEGIFRQDGVDEFADHGMFAGADEVEVFAFDLVHHVFHFGKTHDACYYVAADHEGRDAVGEAFANHEVAGVREHGRVQAGDIAHEVVEAVATGFAGAVQVDAAEFLHDIGVVGDFIVGHKGLTEFLKLDVFAVVFANGHGGVDDIGDYQHAFADLIAHFGFFLLHLRQLAGYGLDFFLGFFGFVLFALAHQLADFFTDDVALLAQFVTPGFGCPEGGVQLQHFVHQVELFFLEFFAHVFFYQVGVGAHEFYVQHVASPFF